MLGWPFSRGGRRSADERAAGRASDGSGLRAADGGRGEPIRGMRGLTGDPGSGRVVGRGMNALKRTLSALVLTGGAALALTPVAAHADEPAIQGPPITQRVTDIVDHPGQAVQDTKTAVEVTGAAAGAATGAMDSSLTGAGGALSAGLPKAPKVG